MTRAALAQSNRLPWRSARRTAMKPPPKSSSRAGNALIATMIVVVVLASMLALSSERMMGMNQLAGFNLRNQQTTYAAEAGASLVEGCIYAASGNNQSLTTDIQNIATGVQSSTTWLNYMGYVGPTGQQAVSYANNGLPNLWIGNCLVQWRLEPVTVYSQTYQCNTLAPYVPTASGNTPANTYAPPTASTTNQFLYNYQVNPNLQGVPPPNAMSNPGFYHYRIIATAYYMQDLATATTQLGLSTPLNIANVTPWSVPQEALAVAQVERYVEVKLVNLFQYVIFYAAVGPTGDIEFHPGPPLTITGAVRSNGSIYCGGNGTGYTNLPTGDYHGSANEGGQVNIGTSANPVAITAVGGIFRMRKAGNYWFAQQNPAAAAVINPMSVPLTGGWIGGIQMTASNDLNGDDVNSHVFQLNGLVGADNPIFAGVTTNDSRGGLTVSQPGNFEYIKDAVHGATILQTLSNFPQLAGYPFESQQVVPPGVGSSPTPLYDSGAPLHYLTINPSHYPASQVLYYTGNNFGAGFTNVQPNPTANPVYASDLPLFWMQQGTNYFADIWPAQPSTHTSSVLSSFAPNSYANTWPALNVSIAGLNFNPYNTGYIPFVLPPNNYLSNIFDTYLPVSFPISTATPNPVPGSAVEGYFLNESMRGVKGSVKTGLTIRERGAPNLNFKWWRTFDTALTGPTGTLIMTNAPLPGSTLATRGQPNFPYVWNQCGPTTLTLNPNPPPVGNTEMVNAYIAMLEANYAVYLGQAQMGGYLQPYDITASFFNFNTGIAQASGSVLDTVFKSAGLIATQDFFMNWREASWMEVNHYLTAAEAANYNIDALTLNIGNVCSYLQSTPWASVDPGGVTGNVGMLNTAFSGIIYVQRTPRAADWGAVGLPANYGPPMQATGAAGLLYPNYDALSPLGYNPSFITNVADAVSLYIAPFASSGASNNLANGASYPVVGNVTVGNVGSLPTTAPGQANVWSVYPSPKVVRVFNGAAINWGGVQPAAANRPQGLTVITPNPCYMWGDYNIQTYPDTNGTAQITPCAIYCDGLTDMSSSWVDNANTYAAGEPNTSTSTSYICSVVINNLPTDSESTYCGGSNGTHNVIRYCENWGATWTFEGSLVVLNRMRYTRSYQTTPTPTITTVCPLSNNGSLYAANSSGGYYSPPTRVYQFNSDLLSSAGQPPASLSGISVQRVVSTVNIINK
jgi:hypothetical protein